MKKQILSLVATLIFSIYSFSNPIMPESIIAEVYFENDEWFLLIDNEFLWIYEIENFENLQIYCSNGLLDIKDDFLPDSTQMFTILTNDDLYTPIEILKTGDFLQSFLTNSIYGTIEFTYLEWNDVLPSPVCGPSEGQSLSIIGILVGEYDYEWWLVKNSAPLINGGGGSYSEFGSFSGYIYDQNNVPVEGATIQYIDPFYQQQFWTYFDTLITDNNGYFELEYLPARNYFISHIYLDNQQFEIEEYVSIEPESLNFNEYVIDYTVGYQNEKDIQDIEINNYPNPFFKTTQFIINTGNKINLDDVSIYIYDLNGRIVSIAPVRSISGIDDRITCFWNNSTNLPSGNYIYHLLQNENVLAFNKMTIISQ